MLIGLVSVLQAQPVFNSNHVPTAGSILTFGVATVPPSFALAPGELQTWNFTNDSIEETITLEFLSPASIPAAALVPGCNFVLKSTFESFAETDYEFSSLSPAGWFSLGYTTDINLVEDIYDVPRAIFEFPLTMGSNSTAAYYSTYYYVGAPEIDSSKYVSTSLAEVSVIAHGNLTINLTTYQVLLQKIITTYIDSSFNYSNGNWVFENTSSGSYTYYRFIAPSAGGIVMEISTYLDEFENEEWDVAYMLSSTITSIEQTTKIKEVELYPNPASSILTITTPTTEHQVIHISDVSGKIVRSINTGSQTSVTIDIQDLAKGMYFVNLSDNSGNISGSKKLIVQ